MAAFDPDLLARWTGGRWTAAPSVPICGFATDSRLLRPGQVFVALNQLPRALNGESSRRPSVRGSAPVENAATTGNKSQGRDGHAFLEAAQNAGASAALVDAPKAGASLAQLVVGDALEAFQAIARKHRRGFHGPVVGISGSAGKTSTKDLLAILLGGAGDGDGRIGGSPAPVLATQGNLNNHLGVPLTLTRLDPAIHAFAVVEAGISAPGEMAALASMIEPDVALITLVAPAHLRDLGEVEIVAREKAVLAAHVRRGGAALFPQSCAQYRAFRELKVPKIVLARDVVARGASVVFTVNHREGATEVALQGSEPTRGVFALPRVSEGMAQNAALALYAALRLGIDRATLQDRLRGWRPAALRGEVRRESGRLLYLDCYNANPASMADALGAFAGIAPAAQPRFYLIGCMEELGPEAGRYHRELGMSLGIRPADTLVVLGDFADEVREGAVRAGGAAARILAAISPEEVSAHLAAFRGAVFVKGSRKYELERYFHA